MLTRARSLFDEGLAFVDAQEWDQAVLRFEEVLRIRSSSVVIYNLASALVHLGRLVEAVELLRPIVGDTSIQDVGAAAKQLLASIQPRIASLTLRVEGAAPGDAVFVGFRQVPLEHLGRPVNVDPGLAEVRVERNAAVLAERRVELGEGQVLQLELSVPARADLAPTPAQVAEASAAGEADSDATSREHRPITKRPWFWIAGAGVVVAATVVAIVVATSGGTSTKEPVEGDAGLISGTVMPP